MSMVNKIKKKQTEDARDLGGKQLITTRLFNHYRALSNIKSNIISKDPSPLIDLKRSKNLINNQIQMNNVRQTYKGVQNIKSVVKCDKPSTFNMTMKLSNYKSREKFEDFEHIRRLKAMSKRILSLGKPHERKKNIYDPIANPAYFFRNSEDDKGVKFVSLDEFSRKIDEINRNEKNKNLLGKSIYEAVGVYSKRPNSSITSRKIDLNIYEYKNNITKCNNKEIYTHSIINPKKFLEVHEINRKKIN